MGRATIAYRIYSVCTPFHSTVGIWSHRGGKRHADGVNTVGKHCPSYPVFMRLFPCVGDHCKKKTRRGGILLHRTYYGGKWDLTCVSLSAIIRNRYKEMQEDKLQQGVLHCITSGSTEFLGHFIKQSLKASCQVASEVVKWSELWY